MIIKYNKTLCIYKAYNFKCEVYTDINELFRNICKKVIIPFIYLYMDSVDLFNYLKLFVICKSFRSI